MNETAGYVVLTTKRFLVIEVSGPETRTFVDAPHGSTEALSLGKRYRATTRAKTWDGGTVDEVLSCRFTARSVFLVRRLGSAEGPVSPAPRSATNP
jgi:hypothetical protein